VDIQFILLHRQPGYDRRPCRARRGWVRTRGKELRRVLDGCFRRILIRWGVPTATWPCSTSPAPSSLGARPD